MAAHCAAGYPADCAALARVACPALVLHGELDEYGSAAQPALIRAQCAAPVQVEILAGLGHMPQREQPARVVARVATFLAEQPPG